MIGQSKLKSLLSYQISKNVFPRFSILTGIRGSGKKLLCKYIADKLNATLYPIDTSVDSIRSLGDLSYKLTNRILFMIADADNMSVQAMNALLKTVEEPHGDIYIVMTLEDKVNTLPTILSRAIVFPMDTYSTDDILAYYTMNYSGATSSDKSLISSVCIVPGDVDMLVNNGTKTLYSFVEKVVDNIATVSGANAFKISANIKFKDTDQNKYDLRLFWQIFSSICLSRLATDIDKYINGIIITSKWSQELRYKNLSRQMLFDMWLLDIRKAWL